MCKYCGVNVNIRLKATENTFYPKKQIHNKYTFSYVTCYSELCKLRFGDTNGMKIQSGLLEVVYTK